MFKQALVVGALAVGLSPIGTTAQAAKPDVVEQFHDQFTVPEDDLTALCGFDITFTVDDRGTFREGDGWIHVTAHGSFVLTNTANGKTLTNEWRVNYKGTFTETVDENGILTVRFRDQHSGVPERWRDANGKILIADRGNAVFDGEIIVDLHDPADPSDDEVLHFHEDVTTNGQHPILNGDGLDPSLACELLA